MKDSVTNLVLAKNPSIIDIDTGEVVDITLASNMQLSKFLTKVVYVRTRFAKAEKKIKEFIKKERLSEIYFIEDDGEKHLFGNHKLTRYNKRSFDKRLFEKKASEKEKEILERAERIKEKYYKSTEIIKFV